MCAVTVRKCRCRIRKEEGAGGGVGAGRKRGGGTGKRGAESFKQRLLIGTRGARSTRGGWKEKDGEAVSQNGRCEAVAVCA